MQENQDLSQKKLTFSDIVKFIVKLAIAGGLIAWIIISDHEKIIAAFTRLSPWVLLISGLCIFMQITLTSLRWNWLIRTQGYHIPFSSFFILTFQGCFANLFIPAGAVGGDIVKAALIAKQMPPGRKLDAAVSILTDRIVGMAGLFTLTFVMFLLCLPEILELNHTLQMAAFLIALLCLAGICAATVVFLQDLIFRWKPAAMLLAFFDKHMKGFPSKIMNSVSAYRKHWKTLLLTTLFSAFVMSPLLITAAAVPLCILSEHAPSIKHIMTATSFGNTASVVPLTPGGFGTRDAVAKEFYKIWGADSGAASTTVLIYSAMLLINYLFGGIFFLIPVKKEEK